MRYRYSLDINTSAAQLFDCLTSTAKLKDWMDGLVSIEPSRIKKRKLKARQQLIFKDDKGKLIIKEQVIAFESNKVLGLKWDSDQMEVEVHYEILPAKHSELCRLHVQAKATFFPKYLNILSFLIGSVLKRQWTEDLRRLKIFAEKSASN